MNDCIYCIKPELYKKSFKNKMGFEAKINKWIFIDSYKKYPLDQYTKKDEFEQAIAMANGISIYTKYPYKFEKVNRAFDYIFAPKPVRLSNIADVETLLQDVITSYRIGMNQDYSDLIFSNYENFCKFPLFYQLPNCAIAGVMSNLNYSNVNFDLIKSLIDSAHNRLDEQINRTFSSVGLGDKQSLVDERDELKKKLIIIENDNNDLVEKFTECLSTISVLKKKLVNHAAIKIDEYKGLREEYNDLHKQNIALKEKIDELEKSKPLYTEKILEKLYSDLQEKNTELQDKYNSEVSERARLENEYKKAMGEKIQLEKENEELKNRIEEQESKYDELNRAQQELIEKIDQRGGNKKFVIEKQKLQNEINELRSSPSIDPSEFAKQKNLIDNLYLEIEDYEKEIEKLKGKNLDLENDMAVLRGEGITKDKTIHDLQEKIKRFEEEAMQKFILPLLRAAGRGDVKELKAVLEERGDVVNMCNKERLTALHIAAMRGHVDAVSFLLERGADQFAKDGNGLTPFEWATNQKIRTLLNKSAT